MKRFLNLALALGLLVGTANAASAASIGTWIDRLTGGYNSYNYGYPYNSYNNYNYGYGYPTSYYGGYVNPYTSYYSGYNNYYSNYGYGYNPYYQPTRSLGSTLGNLLLNWF